jgi:23S rRNA (cytidine1920-2'-O)/16S rRNA (cytidine1409-2'-O)-methyltransferase
VSEHRVLVGGAIALKPSRLVAPGEPISLEGPPARFASRGGEKLDAALERFGLDPSGKEVLDVGASTGGFTDCLLQRGASRVVAVDVGHGQMLLRLRYDKRVELMEGVNARNLAPEGLGGRRFDIVSADLSFISLRAVAPALVGMAKEGGDLVLLVKPQFEAGRQAVSRGRGVVRDRETWAKVLGDVTAAYREAGAATLNCMASPLRGRKGNVEFFLHLRRGGEDRLSVEAMLARLPPVA